MLKLDTGLHFDNSFQRLPSFLWEEVSPTPLKAARLIHVTELKHELGLSSLTDEELKSWLNGEARLAGDQTLSSRYAGHQFGVWAGQLGDGRAISLGEILASQGQRFEVQTKGSGLTPFSRMGDGKAVIRSSVREYLCSEAMQGLGIPTTRVLGLLTGQDEVYREKVERSAIVARVFPSNLRFGHFELCFHFEQKESFKALTEYARSTFFQGASLEVMLEEIVTRTATLLARWQAVGFCHGVMNTDNMSLIGLTIDYGPFGFLEDTVLHHICNHSDHQGRYAYDRQPRVAMWNLERLLVCFMEMVPKSELERILMKYPVVFEAEFRQNFRGKLGLTHEREEDQELILQLMQTLGTLNLDFTFFFRILSRYQRGMPESLKAIWDYYGDRQELKAWLTKYDKRLSFETDEAARHQRMLKTNPKYILRNYIAQEVIEDVEADESGKLQTWLKILSKPFDEHPEYEKYSGPTPVELKDYQVSCSS